MDARQLRNWQMKATEDDLPMPCQNGEYHCRRSKTKPNLALVQIKHLDLIAYTMDSRRSQQTMKVEGQVIHDLNEALTKYRLRRNDNEIKDLCTVSAERVLRNILSWQKKEPDCRDVAISGHVEGSNVEFTFELYRCVRVGQSQQWKKIHEWTAKLADRRDVGISTLHNLYPAQQDLPNMFTSSLSQYMVEFIHKI